MDWVETNQPSNRDSEGFGLLFFLCVVLLVIGKVLEAV